MARANYFSFYDEKYLKIKRATLIVIPAQAGIQPISPMSLNPRWIPVSLLAGGKRVRRRRSDNNCGGE
jgi:hypothetical protein